MATIFKKTVTRSLPPNAELFTREVKGIVVRLARWRNRFGKMQTAETTVGQDGAIKIKVKAVTYTAKFRDGEGIVREVSTGCRDKQAAQSVLSKLTNRAELVKAQVMTSDQARIADHQQVPLSKHIADYVAYQTEQRRNADYIQNCKTRLNESAEGCGFKLLCEMNVDSLQTWLAGQRDSERAMSIAVHNGFVEVWVAFGNWCCGKRTTGGKRHHMNGEKRILKNPFAGMGKLDVNMDRRRVARALTEDELNRLLKAARTRPVISAQTVRNGPNKGQQLIALSSERRTKLERLGHERAIIYKTAILTGLRKSELRTLTVGDLSFGDVPFVKLKHGNEKNRQGSTLPLRSDLAADLRKWVAGKESTDRVFNVPAGLLAILDRDIAAAGIPKVDAEGRVVHVHALRHSFGTHLSRAGVAPRTAQAAMRHSNIALTMTTYTDSRLLDTSAAVESLPSFSLDFDEQGQTEHEYTIASEQPRVVAPIVAPDSVQVGPDPSITGPFGAISEISSSNPETKKPRETRGSDECGREDLNLQGVAPTRPST